MLGNIYGQTHCRDIGEKIARGSGKAQGIGKGLLEYWRGTTKILLGHYQNIDKALPDTLLVPHIAPDAACIEAERFLEIS